MAETITASVMEGSIELTTTAPSMPFSAVIEQKHVRTLLFKAIVNDRLAHGFLFAGPTGTGRIAMAIELARVINCEKSSIDAARDECSCDSCRLITSINHPNLSFIFPRAPELDKKKGAVDNLMLKNLETLRHDVYAPLETSRTGIIRVEQIRELRRSMSLTADRRGVRVAIIKPAENMNPNASNALLKLLEEPPDRCTLILITDSARQMLPTILSRCQKVAFSPLSESAVSANLIAENGLSKPDADQIAGISMGSLAVAKSMIGEDHQTLIKESLDFLRASVQGQAARICKISDRWSKSGRKSDVMKNLDYTSVWIRDALRIKSANNADKNANISAGERFETSAKLADRYTYNQLSNAWSEIEAARQGLRANAMPQLVLTTLALKIGIGMRSQY